MTYEIEILNDDGTIQQKKEFKSIREMSQKTNIPYHNLKVIYERNNEQSKKYKNTAVNNLSKNIRVKIKNPIIVISE
jgi:hypothetical protein